jgi:hypothetical protein
VQFFNDVISNAPFPGALSMSLLSRLLLIPALSLWCTVATAKDLPGLPKDILGTFALDPERCQHESYIEEFFEEGGNSFYGICGRSCRYLVSSHRRFKDGYVLNVHFDSPIFGNRVEKLHVKKLGKNKLRLHFLGNRSFNLGRCNRA